MLLWFVQHSLINYSGVTFSVFEGKHRIRMWLAIFTPITPEKDILWYICISTTEYINKILQCWKPERAFVYTRKFSYAYVEFSSGICFVNADEIAFSQFWLAIWYAIFGFVTKLNSRKLCCVRITRALKLQAKCENLKIHLLFCHSRWISALKIHRDDLLHILAAWFDDYIIFLFCLAIYSDFGGGGDLAKSHKLYEIARCLRHFWSFSSDTSARETSFNFTNEWKCVAICARRAHSLNKSQRPSSQASFWITYVAIFCLFVFISKPHLSIRFLFSLSKRAQIRRVFMPKQLLLLFIARRWQ